MIPVPGPLSSWNGLDWLLAGLVAVSAIRGLFRGLLQAIFGLAAVLCGFFVASAEFRPAAAWILNRGWTHSPQTAAVAAYLGILAGIMVAFGVAGAIGRRAAHAAGLGLADRLLGGLLGVVRGVLIGAAVVLSIRALAPASSLLLRSRLSSYFLAAGHAVSFVVPHALR